MEDLNIKSQFQTPVNVVRYMVSMCPLFAKEVLEPTPGLGNIVNEIRKQRPDIIVTAPDDFFLLNDTLKFDCIIANPPFSSKSANLENAPISFHKSGMKVGYQILLECMKRSDNIIILMPWFTISDSDVRLRQLKNFGMKSLTALPRSTFKYARIQTVIMELVNGYKGDTVFKVFEEEENDHKMIVNTLNL